MARYLVTGGCGSIGGALVKRLLSRGFAVCSFDNSELQLFNQVQDLSQQYPNLYKPFLGDVRDYKRLMTALRSVDYVYHCAALKHVNLCEYNPFEALKTNVEGTHNVAEASLNSGVTRLIFASSDKAVNPSSTMGASKLLAERITLASSSYAGNTNFTSACVRFGNVWDTTGSVGHIFKHQATNGLPLTLTSKGMTRFFITIDNALDLCEYAMSRCDNHQIYVSNMGTLKIHDLALAFSSYFPAQSTISIIGPKPGEKLYEELFTEQEAQNITMDGEYFIIHPSLSQASSLRALRSDDTSLPQLDPYYLLSLLDK
jgi:UDP-N-acetylglucosamine 4,6-dehydratase